MNSKSSQCTFDIRNLIPTCDMIMPMKGHHIPAEWIVFTTCMLILVTFSCVCIHDVVSAGDIHACFPLYEVYMILSLVHVTVSNTSQQYDPLCMYWPLQKSTFNIIHVVLVLRQLVLGTNKIPLKRAWSWIVLKS